MTSTVSTRRGHLGGWLRSLTHASFGLYLVLLLAANTSVLSGGPLAWLPIWRLPAAEGIADVGLVSLLPLISISAWLTSRRVDSKPTPFRWGWPRLTIPLLALVSLAGFSLALACWHGDCEGSDMVRLAILAGHLFWIYLFVVNEKPDVFWPIVTVLAIQSAIAVSQFVAQSDMGLRWLGELSLNPDLVGVSIVMREETRWLRGYGLTPHPNALARTLVPGLMILVLLGHQPTRIRQVASLLAIGLAVTGMFVAFSRWAWVCLLFGLTVAALPSLRLMAGTRRPRLPSPLSAIALCIGIGGLMFALFFGNALAARTIRIESPTEERSLWERGRDQSIALQLIANHPALGVGFGQYLPHAREKDAWAEPVHSVPLLIGAELGAAGLLLWLSLLVGPLIRRDAWGSHASASGLWLSFWLLGIFYVNPYPLMELRSALMSGLIAGLLALTSGEDAT